MEGREARRLELTREANRNLRHPEARTIFPAVGEDGRRTILVALADDTLGSLYASLVGCGSAVNVIVADAAPDALQRAVITFHSGGEAADGSRSHVETCLISASSEVGMLLDALRMSGGPLRCVLVGPGIEAELVQPPLAPLPA